MPKMIILRGVSGSGKSTWARLYAQNTGAVIVSRDAIRVMRFGPVADTQEYYDTSTPEKKTALGKREHEVTLIEHGIIDSVLRGGLDVIVDNTNIEWKYLNGYVKRARKLGAEVEIKVFDVSLNEAIARDIRRGTTGGRFVGDIVIRKQYQRLQGTKDKTVEPVFVPAPYEGTPGKPKAFMVDIDGTLAHMRNHRSPYDWKNVGKDDVDEVIAGVVNALKETNWEDYTVIVMSGRDESCRYETVEWLNRHGIWSDLLFMRPERDMRPDNIVKAELFDTHVRDNYDVQFVLDDRQQVVDMWRSMGITCLQVAPGDF